jgi:hypothetical protein
MSSTRIYNLTHRKENLIRLLKLIENSDKNINIRSSLRSYYFNKIQFYVKFINSHFFLKKKMFKFFLDFYFSYRIELILNHDNFGDVLSYLKLKYRSFSLLFLLKRNKIVILGNNFNLLEQLIKSLQDLNIILSAKKTIISSIKKNFHLKSSPLFFEIKIRNKFIKSFEFLMFYKLITCFNNFFLFPLILVSKLHFILTLSYIYQIIFFIHFQLYYGYFTTINKKL